MKKKKENNEGEDHAGKALVALPNSLRFDTLTIVGFDNNRLTHAHLDTLFAQCPLLSVCSFRNNRVARVPWSITGLKKLKQLLLDDNPVGWPRRPSKGDWKRAVSEEPPGRRVFRIYGNEVVGDRLPFVDVEMVAMSDPMYKDKDEDRSDVKFGGCSWSTSGDQLFTLPIHDRAVKNRFGDPDVSRRPWYRNDLGEGEEARIFPASWFGVTVCDGHGGYWVAEALRQNLLNKFIAAKLTEKTLPDKCEETVVNLYREVDKTLLARLEAGAGAKKDGSTCVNVIVNSSHLLVSHVGDSRCVVGFEETGKIEQLTTDHEPDLPAEREMVEKKGGKVEFHKNNIGGGVWRVCGDLAMTRSFGDPNVKPFTTCDPDVRVLNGALFEADSIVVASDGLWHHVSSEEAVKAVRKCDNAEQAASKLFEMVESAIRKGKNDTFGIDNTMIVVAKLTRGSQPADMPPLDKPL